MIRNPARRKRPNGAPKTSWRNRRAFIGLSAPAVIWFTVFMILPLFFMVYVSFIDWTNITSPTSFAGLENYQKLFTDGRFHAAIWNTFWLAVVGLPIVYTVGFMFAFFLSQQPPGYRFFRVVFFTPALLSVTAASMMFVGLYLPSGVVNALLTSAGLENLTRVWLANPATVLWALLAIYIWGGIGWASILFYASLSGLPEDVFEMARIDGAGYWTRMWRIAFPLNIDFWGVILMMDFVFLLLGFAGIVILLTGGGPGSRTVTLGYLIYEKAFVTRQLGYSQAIAVFTFIVGMLGMLTIRSLTRRSHQ